MLQGPVVSLLGVDVIQTSASSSVSTIFLISTFSSIFELGSPSDSREVADKILPICLILTLELVLVGELTVTVVFRLALSSVPVEKP